MTEPRVDIDHLLAEYEEWSDHRAELYERDCTDDTPSSNEWYDSDDYAPVLLEQAIDIIKELRDALPPTPTSTA